MEIRNFRNSGNEWLKSNQGSNMNEVGNKINFVATKNVFILSDKNIFD